MVFQHGQDLFDGHSNLWSLDWFQKLVLSQEYCKGLENNYSDSQVGTPQQGSQALETQVTEITESTIPLNNTHNWTGQLLT